MHKPCYSLDPHWQEVDAAHLFSPLSRTCAHRPQYIYGPLTNKRDYLDFFFDRVVHGLDFVPLPLHGDQLVALTHAEDVASMLASVVGNENAVNQVRARDPIRLCPPRRFVVTQLVGCDGDPPQREREMWLALPRVEALDVAYELPATNQPTIGNACGHLRLACRCSTVHPTAISPTTDSSAK